jgi:hypothetical protein
MKSQISRRKPAREQHQRIRVCICHEQECQLVNSVGEEFGSPNCRIWVVVSSNHSPFSHIYFVLIVFKQVNPQLIHGIVLSNIGPSTFALSILGLLALSAIGRRRRRF